jgi:hypothetical protein
MPKSREPTLSRGKARFMWIHKPRWIFSSLDYWPTDKLDTQCIMLKKAPGVKTEVLTNEAAKSKNLTMNLTMGGLINL